MPAQSSRSIGFLMLVGSSLTLCGLIYNNNAMLSPSLLRYDPSKSNYGLLVTIVPSVMFAFLQTNPSKSRQSPSCLCGTAEAPLGMLEATPTTHVSRSRTLTNSNLLLWFTYIKGVRDTRRHADQKRKKENTQPKGGMGERHAATTQGF